MESFMERPLKFTIVLLKYFKLCQKLFIALSFGLYYYDGLELLFLSGKTRIQHKCTGPSYAVPEYGFLCSSGFKSET